MIRIFRFSVIVAFALALVGLVPVGAAHAADTGAIRLVAASPDAPAFDIFVNGKKWESHVTYKTITDYATLPAGNTAIAVYASPSNGQGTPLINIPSFAINSGSLNTIVALGLVGNKSLTALPLSDNDWRPASGQSKVRYVHTSPDAPAVDVVAQGKGNVFSDVSFKSVGNYVETAPGPITLSTRVTGTNTSLLNSTINLKPDTAYTVFAVGEASNKSLSTIVSTDSPMVAPATMPNTGQGELTAAVGTSVGMIWVLAAFFVLCAALASVLQRRQVRITAQPDLTEKH